VEVVLHAQPVGGTRKKDRTWPGVRPKRQRSIVEIRARIVSRCVVRDDRPVSVAQAAAVASLAHERRDGSGYHRRLASSSVPILARILAAADVYQALISERPYRAALTADAAAAELRREVTAGRLDSDAAGAVLAAAGHSAKAAGVHSRRGDLPAGLSMREVEVLRLLARGLTNKEIAQSSCAASPS
jgi:hypothetical protein